MSNDLIKQVKLELSKVTGKSKIFLTKRGNTSIKESLKYVKSKGHENILIQDQGGWLTYPQFVKKLKLKLEYISTDYGLINEENKITFSNCTLLFNTMPGYGYLQDISIIDSKINDNCIIINDIAGSIGHEQSKWGDIIFGSFGKEKPINLEKGGFIATNLEDFNIEAEEEFTKEELELLLNKLENLPKRIEFFSRIREKIINDLEQINNFNIIHKNLTGINVIIQFNEEDIQTKEKLIQYCENNNYEFTECPRYIRINESGISIEVKRLIE